MAIRYDSYGNPIGYCAEKPDKPLKHPPKCLLVITPPSKGK